MQTTQSVKTLVKAESRPGLTLADVPVPTIAVKAVLIPLLCLFVSLIGQQASGRGPIDPPPNILIILADDLGFGDVSCSNPEAKVQTPHLDRLAGHGMRFTDAHSAATVCTPTRYSLMTGQMCFRTGYRSVFSGAGGPCLIPPQRLTIAEMLKRALWSMKPYALPDTDSGASGQLYDLAADPGETANLFSRHPEVVARLKALLDESVRKGRSAPLRSRTRAAPAE